MTRKNTARPGRPKSVEKRHQILAAAARLFLDCGFKATSMDTVAKQASVSKQTLYSHFDNKESLFRSCIEDKVKEYGLDLSAVSNGDAVEDTLAYFASQLIDLFDDPNVRDMYRVLIAESHAQPDLCRLFYSAGPMAAKTALARYLDLQHRTGRLRVQDSTDAAELFISMVETRFLTKILLNIDTGLTPAQRILYVNKRVREFMKLVA